eukprot:TRINITY_DN69459_c0_g2_i1.p2 TRINITY_DN69459_c0_g2~~TRINITY_DN69459_c0_g2_i1.p2  ORF type:complete len:182 (+),score=39.35 TRINITY_DN69459_c0_g2_i1:170-715(+)
MCIRDRYQRRGHGDTPGEEPSYLQRIEDNYCQSYNIAKIGEEARQASNKTEGSREKNQVPIDLPNYYKKTPIPCIETEITTQEKLEAPVQMLDHPFSHRPYGNCSFSTNITSLSSFGIWKIFLNYEIELLQNFPAVSYTHLTLPTILLVQISVVAVSFKKKLAERSARTGVQARRQTERTG